MEESVKSIREESVKSIRERCLSGRKSSPRKRVALQGARGFESHSLRHVTTRIVTKNQVGSHAAKTSEPCQVLTEAALRETFRATWASLAWFLVTVRAVE